MRSCVRKRRTRIRKKKLLDKDRKTYWFVWYKCVHFSNAIEHSFVIKSEKRNFEIRRFEKLIKDEYLKQRNVKVEIEIKDFKQIEKETYGEYLGIKD